MRVLAGSRTQGTDGNGKSDQRRGTMSKHNESGVLGGLLLQSLAFSF